MPEGLSAIEAGKLTAEHAKAAEEGPGEDRAARNRNISIAEAVLLSVVTLLAAWSGYAAAKWSTESRVELSRASADRTNASRANLQAMELRNFDSTAFEAWFSAYIAKNPVAMRVAVHRFRPEFRDAFDAWRATNPDTNPDAPRGPTYMPEYRQPARAKAEALDARAEKASQAGAKAGETSDRYVRTTVFLASVLFIVGISTHFPIRSVRYGLVGLGVLLLLLSLIQLAQLPGPPA